jgi:antitoxin (DNA-binding transcriptional repressor) of toxin-antitoxin stability system
MARHISSEKARAGWRELLDSVAAGEAVVIERYGQPVAILAPFRDEAATREPGPIYDLDREQLKAEIVAEVMAEIEAAQMEPISWTEGLAELQRLVRESGSPFTGMSTDEIVEKMRETRRQVFEEMYGHLY